MIRRLGERAVWVSSWALTAALCLGVVLFLGYLAVKGAPHLGMRLIFGASDPLDALIGRARVFDGIFPAVAGTICLVVLSAVLALPLGVGSGVYLAEYARPKPKKLLGALFDVLAGVPSIVVGLFGFSLAVFLHHHFSERLGPCLAVSAVSLSILVLPYIVKSTQTALEGVHPDIRKTGVALGATRLQNVVHVLIPVALPGIGSGLFLAIGRCAEDTAVILLTGAVATAGVPGSLLAPYEALPFYIYYISNQYADPAELASGYGACLVLLGVCAVLLLLAYGMQKHLAGRMLYRA